MTQILTTQDGNTITGSKEVFQLDLKLDLKISRRTKQDAAREMMESNNK